MKEYYLIPVGEYNLMEKSKVDSSNKTRLLSNESLSTNVILDLFNRMIKNDRLGNEAGIGSEMSPNITKNDRLENEISPNRTLGDLDGFKAGNNNSSQDAPSSDLNDMVTVKKKPSSDIKSSGQKRTSDEFKDPKKFKIEHPENSESSKKIENFISRIVPTGYEDQAISTLKNMLKAGSIEIDKNGMVSIPETDFKVDLGLFIRMLFVKNASIKGHEDMIGTILNHIDVDAIRNPKVIGLTRGGLMSKTLRWCFRHS